MLTQHGTTAGDLAVCTDYRVETARKLRFMRDPRSYPDHPPVVEVVETHYSWVFLTTLYAYKLKKPMCGKGFDFRPIEARRCNALTELRLNRRLAADVYLAAVPLTLGTDGALALDGTGVPVDWLVKMRRLPAARMLDRRLVGRQWRYGDIGPIARQLAEFFAAAPPVRIAPPQFLAQLNAELTATRISLSAIGEPGLSSKARPALRELSAFLVRRAELFRRRARAGRVVDAHGDLRPEHIYIDGSPRIIDCLEFRADLRRTDPVSELAFLALECRRLGGPPIGDRLLCCYRQRSGDAPSRDLVRFYTAFNAMIRARIAAQHLSDPGARPRQEWIDRAVAYLAIAAKACRVLRR